MSWDSNTNLMRKMGLSMNEIDRRLHMFDLTPSARKTLKSFAATLQAALPDILDEFYEKLLEADEVTAIIDSPEKLARLRDSMMGFIVTLFASDYDEAYVNGRLRIGKVHKKLSVTPKLYMSGVSTLQDILDRKIDTLCPMDLNPEDTKEALHKALLLDTQLVFDAYIDSYHEEMEEARQEVNQFASALEIKIEALTRELHEQSRRDELTGLFNRRTFNEYFERELAVAQRYKLPLCLIYFDLNGFKAVNDTYGHDAGDCLLQQVGQSLKSITRSVDIACRFGGDEFCVVLPRCDLERVGKPLNRLIEHFDVTRRHEVTFSVGVVQTGPETFEDTREPIGQADSLMYAAKARAHKAVGHYIETAG